MQEETKLYETLFGLWERKHGSWKRDPKDAFHNALAKKPNGNFFS